MLSGFVGEWNMGWLFCLHLICQGWVFYHNFWNFSWIPGIVSNFEVFPHPWVSRIFSRIFYPLKWWYIHPCDCLSLFLGWILVFQKGMKFFFAKEKSGKLIFSASFEDFTCCFLQALFLYGVVKNRLVLKKLDWFLVKRNVNWVS